MKKKQFSCRISSTSYDFLEKVAKENKIHHPISETIPNISKTLDYIISAVQHAEENGINISMLKNEELYSQLNNITNNR